jgi:hypothetical protein
VTLFPTIHAKSKSKPRPSPWDPAALRIPTGAPRLVESSTDRSARSSTDAWQALLDVVRRSSSARLTLLSGRSGVERVSCPWERVTSCDLSCRCGGAGTVTVSFLRAHYESLADDLARLVRPVSIRRKA